MIEDKEEEVSKLEEKLKLEEKKLDKVETALKEALVRHYIKTCYELGLLCCLVVKATNDVHVAKISNLEREKRNLSEQLRNTDGEKLELQAASKTSSAE